MIAVAQDSHVEQLVIELVQQTKVDHRIFDGSLAEDVCTRLHLNLTYTTKAIDQDGSFDPTSRTIMINLRRAGHKERRQFTIFHEIVHF